MDSILTTFLHDGVEEIADYNASGTLLRRYVHGPGVDEYLVMYTGSGTANKSYFHANHQGSIVAMSDDNGDVTEQHAYDSYGNSDDLTGNPFRYTGRRLDEETGLYYYRARYYSPKLGRFLQTDPIGYGDGLNWYAYVGNDPVNRTDPSGAAYWWVVELVKGGVKKITKLASKKAAIRARQKGNNVLSQNRQSATQIEKAASPTNKILRREKRHKLKDGSGKTGLPHAHGVGLEGHSFWGSALSVLLFVDYVLGELDPSLSCSDVDCDGNGVPDDEENHEDSENPNNQPTTDDSDNTGNTDPENQGDGDNDSTEVDTSGSVSCDGRATRLLC